MLRPEVPAVDFELHFPLDPVVPGKTRVESVLVENKRLTLVGSTEGLGISGY